MISRTHLIEAARSFIGVRYRHQHTDRRMGMDCIGLIRATAAVVDYEPTKTFISPPYRVNPDPVQFVGLLRAYFDEIPAADIKPGDVFCMDYGKGIQHVGILGDGNKIIHSERRFNRVAEHDIDAEWRAKIDKAGIGFQWRGIVETD